MTNANSERRAHRRYEVKDNVLLYNGSTFAEIINISMGGIYCRFLLDGREYANPVRQIDLLNAKDRLIVQRIFCTDLNWFEELDTPSFGNTTLRDCRLHFVKLNEKQREMLEDFMSSVTETCQLTDC